jgi:DNA-binding IclR family transcriptional regulator
MARPAPAATRAVQILDLLVTHPSERFTLTELVRRTGMSAGSAHAVLAVLEQSGHVTRHRSTRAYSLGPALVVAGVIALEQHPGIDAARHLIGPLAVSLGVEVVVTARTIDEIIFVARAGDHTPQGPGIVEGERVPLIPPFGAVFFAWAPDDEVDAWLERSPDHSIETIARYRAALELVRTRGFAVTAGSDAQRMLGERSFNLADDPSRVDLRDDVAELFATLANENYPLVQLDDGRPFDVGIVAAPVFGPDGSVIAAISATGFAPGLDAATVAEAGQRVRDTAAVATRTARGRLPIS